MTLKANAFVETSLENGELMLLGAGPKQYTAWRFEVRGKLLLPKGAISGQGKVIDRPVLGEVNPFVPVIRNGGFEARELVPSSYNGNQSCHEL